MNKNLRRLHGQVWYGMLPLLPLGIILAWLAIPNREPIRLLEQRSIHQLPVLEKTIERPSYSIEIRADVQKRQRQLIWMNREALIVPTAVIYASADTSFQISTARLIGRIEARGSYGFELDSWIAEKGSRYFFVYDFIHHRVIDRFNIKS